MADAKSLELIRNTTPLTKNERKGYLIPEDYLLLAQMLGVVSEDTSVIRKRAKVERRRFWKRRI